MPTSAQLGWNPFFQSQVREGLVYARVVEEQRGAYRVAGHVDGWVEVSGRFRHEAGSPSEFPAVGDWVGLESSFIHHRLDRRSALSRAAPGDRGQQVVAANIDTVFVVTSATHERNERRVERYVTAVWDGGAVPVVLLNKADLLDDPSAAAEEIRQRLPLVDVHAVSAIDETPAGRDGGLQPCLPYLRPAHTLALIGPSGVGKSTIVNRLAGEARQRTSPVRGSDNKGRHTTSSRQLIELPSGALLIDTPGMREFQLWADVVAVDSAFEDIARLGEGCRFANCEHRTEPKCAVLAAVEAGALSADRLEHFRRLRRETAFEQRKHDPAAAAQQKRRWKKIGQAQKALYRDRDRS